MTTETDVPDVERSVPKPVFTDAEAGHKVFPDSTARSGLGEVADAMNVIVQVGMALGEGA